MFDRRNTATLRELRCNLCGRDDFATLDQLDAHDCHGDDDGDDGAEVLKEEGILIADGGTATLDSFDPEAVEDDRPDDCVCWDATLDVPCFPCFLEGFDTQNPAEPAAEEVPADE